MVKVHEGGGVAIDRLLYEDSNSMQREIECNSSCATTKLGFLNIQYPPDAQRINPSCSLDLFLYTQRQNFSNP